MSGMLWISLATLVFGLTMEAARAILRAKRKAHGHEVLLNRVKRLRLYKMLHFLGADQDEYLRAIPISDINRQIHRCSHCKELESCDSCLHDGKSTVDMNFCPNHGSITGHSKTIRQRRLR